MRSCRKAILFVESGIRARGRGGVSGVSSNDESNDQADDGWMMDGSVGARGPKGVPDGSVRARTELAGG